jgi:hypothetical protein
MSHINQEHIQQEILPIFQTTHTGGKKSSKKKSSDKKFKVKKGGESIPIQTGTYTSTAPVVSSEFSPLPSQNVVMPISVPDMPLPPTTTLAIGGAKKIKKLKKKGKGKKGGDCQEDDNQEGGKKGKGKKGKKGGDYQEEEEGENQEGGKKGKKGKGKGKGKKGGALMDDLQNLAVPFAILLAKQGLESMFSSNEKDASKKTKTMKGGDCGCSGTAIPPVGAPITGGSTNLPKKSLAGGSAKPQKAGKKAITQKFMSLTETIDNFLQKY